MAMAAQMASLDYSVEAGELADMALAQLNKDALANLQGPRIGEHEILEFISTVQADIADRQDVGIADRVP